MAEAGTHWQLVLETVEQRCGYLLASAQWSDCTFVVGAGINQAVLPAHKLILAMASPVFEAMFYGGLSEPNEQIVPIPDIQPEAFRTLLQYIYTGNITIGSFDMAWDLWYGAKKYMLPHLIKECSSYICSVLGPGNVCRAYEFALLFDEESLIDKCIEIISKNTKEVLNNSSFEDVQLNTLITVLSLDHLDVDSELDLIDALARYAKAEQKQQKQLEDNEPPSEKLSELRLEPLQSEEKVLLPSVESTSQTSPAAELHSNTPSESSEVVTSNATADKENFKGKPTIRAAIEKIRFLSLSPQQFAEGPARSGLLTEAESFAVLMNIASTASAVPMPTGFSERREQRQLLSDVQELSSGRASLNVAPRKQERDKQLLKGEAPPLVLGCSDDEEEDVLTPACIVQWLNSGDLPRMTKAARAVQWMLSGEVNPPSISMMIDAGVIAPLVSALDRHDCSDLQFQAAWALTNITAGTREHTLAVVDGGAIPKLIALLYLYRDRRGRGLVEAEQAAWALGNIAGDGPDTRDAVLNLGALPALLPYMQPNTPSALLKTFVWAYSNMCQNTNPSVSFELVSPALPHISELLLLTDKEVLAKACLALSYLTDGPDERIEAVQATPGLMERLIALLGHPALQVQTPALQALGNMLTGSDVQTERCLDAGCLDHIINWLNGTSSHVEKAAWAASNILAENHSQIQRALDKQILEPLINILSEGDAKCKKEAVWAITNLCIAGTASQLEARVSVRFLEPYCRLLSSPDHTALLHTILDGLSTLLQKVERHTKLALCTKLREIGVPELLRTLQQHEQQMVREAAEAVYRLIDA